MARMRSIRVILDDWALNRTYKLLQRWDPLTARRLAFAIKEGITLEEVIALEDRGIEQLTALIIEDSKKRDAPPPTAE
jgi:hypothetical protein